MKSSIPTKTIIFLFFIFFSPFVQLAPRQTFQTSVKPTTSVIIPSVEVLYQLLETIKLQVQQNATNIAHINPNSAQILAFPDMTPTINCYDYNDLAHRLTNLEYAQPDIVDRIYFLENTTITNVRSFFDALQAISSKLREQNDYIRQLSSLVSALMPYIKNSCNFDLLCSNNEYIR